MSLKEILIKIRKKVFPKTSFKICIKVKTKDKIGDKL